MNDISQIDKNFAVKTKIDRPDIKFYNIDEAPFKVYGVFRENGKYRRIPEAVAKTVSEGVYMLHANTSGGRVRFITDSLYVAIHAEMENVGNMPHFALSGSAGFDLYAGNNMRQPSYLPWLSKTDMKVFILLRTGKCGK